MGLKYKLEVDKWPGVAEDSPSNDALLELISNELPSAKTKTDAAARNTTEARTRREQSGARR